MDENYRKTTVKLKKKKKKFRYLGGYYHDQEFQCGDYVKEIEWKSKFEGSTNLNFFYGTVRGEKHWKKKMKKKSLENEWICEGRGKKKREWERRDGKGGGRIYSWKLQSTLIGKLGN